MIYSPLRALQALTRFQHLDPGDLILTGTPVGTALSAPAKPIALLTALLPPARKWQLFLGRQRNNPRYLQDGDLVEATVGTDDGAIDLGTQRTTVRWAR
jgi:2-keto-4-pentenoate hydratase/2-oxohepta-3-ene-1,7-dioic acid hydratase in catechol pathway